MRHLMQTILGVLAVTVLEMLMILTNIDVVLVSLF